MTKKRKGNILSLIAATVIAMLIVMQGYSQQLERYQREREQELRAPNRFLTQRSLTDLGLLGGYYRRAFEQQMLDQARALQRGVPGLQGRFDDEIGMPFLQDGPIDPDIYVVGPYDLMTVSVWGEMPVSHTGYVNPEGSLLVPTVGVIPVAGKTLRDVRSSVYEAVRKQYISGDITVVLEQTRMFTVHVGGNIRNPGPYPASAVQRVDRVLAIAHMPGEAELQRIQQRYLEDPERPQYFRHDEIDPTRIEREPSLRNIILRRQNGDSLHVDLVRYFATGNTIYNPYVQDGDRLIVRPEDLRSNAVAIYGGVRLPGRFEYHPNDSLSVMLEIAQGFTENAIRDSIEIVRFDNNGGKLERILVNGNDILSGKENFALQKNDRVFVWERSEIRRETTVFVQGEVNYAGAFPIEEGHTTLSSIIEMAGGFTKDAAIAEAKIYRENKRELWDPLMANPDYQRLAEMRLGWMNIEGREYFSFESAIRRDIVSVDFRKLFFEGDSKAEVVLEGGDVIIVPRRSNTVYVFGQVANPGYLNLQPGWSFRDYIERAGGISEGAKRSGIRIIKAGTKEWVKPGDTSIEPGDAIWVPRKRDRDRNFYLAFARDVLQITTSLVTLYFFIDSISN